MSTRTITTAKWIPEVFDEEKFAQETFDPADLMATPEEKKEIQMFYFEPRPQKQKKRKSIKNVAVTVSAIVPLVFAMFYSAAALTHDTFYLAWLGMSLFWLTIVLYANS